MATVNLGNIKFNWKGTYNAGTAYAIDDVVSYNGSSYVCISATTGNLPTVTAKWNVMATAGTNGTDVGTTITTQGDLLYRDGSGLQRLAKGTAGQALKMNSGANAPEWGTISSDFVKLAETTVTSSVSSVAFEHGTGDIDFTSGAYQYFKVFFKDVHMADDNERIYAFVRQQSNGSYYTGGSSYRETRMALYGSSTSDLSNDMANIRIFNGGTDTGRASYSTMNGDLTLMNFDDADNHSSIMHQTHMNFIDSSSNDFYSTGGHMVRSAGVHDGIKFQGGSGNIVRGKFSLYGIK